MPRNIIASVPTLSQSVQTAIPSGGLILTLINSLGAPVGAPQTVLPAAQPGSTYSATFSAVPAGTYTATAQNVDNTGNRVGAVVTSQPFDVVDLSVTQTYDVPQQVTLSFAS